MRVPNILGIREIIVFFIIDQELADPIQLFGGNTDFSRLERAQYNRLFNPQSGHDKTAGGLGGAGGSRILPDDPFHHAVAVQVEGRYFKNKVGADVILRRKIGDDLGLANVFGVLVKI